MARITIVPAIDIIEGRCVRLSQGDYAKGKTYDGRPEDVARGFADAGVERIHLVDLEGAKVSSPRNLGTLEAIANALADKGIRIEWGGGLKKDEDLKSAFSAGCTDAVIGSVAVAKPELMKQWLGIYGGESIVLGADVRNGRIAVKGWQEDSCMTIKDLVESFVPSGLTQCIATEISHDGMLAGPAASLYSELKAQWPDILWTASGGICSMDDIAELDSRGIDRVIVGKAYYEGYITLKDMEKWSRNE